MQFRIIFWLLFFAVQQCIAQPLPDLIPYNGGKSWGFADTNGNVRIAAQWSKVEFFKGNTAKVTLANFHYGLIDRAGNYIIPPSRHWNGIWDGAEKTQLNSKDSNGKYGLIDTQNHVLIPYEWDGPGGQLPEGYSASYKMVQKNNRFGVIGKNNQLIIPCNYVSITGRSDLLPIQGFLITDPDNISGANKQGLINSTGELILPPKYSSIQMILSGKDTLLQCTVSLDNESDEHQVHKWFRYVSGKKAAPFDRKNYTMQQAEFIAQTEQILENGMLRIWVNGKEGLLNKNKDTLVSPGTFYVLKDDTLITKTETRLGSDSVFVDIQYRHANSLKNLRPSRQSWIVKPIEIEEKTYRPHYNEVYNTPKIDWTYQTFNTFYKDSIQFHVNNTFYFHPGIEIYIVSGPTISNHKDHSRRTYYAVVDKELNYLVAPMALTIYHYNLPDDIVTVSGYDKVSGQAGFGLQTAAGKELMPLQCNHLFEGLRCNAVIFGLAAWEPPVQKQEPTYYSHHRQSSYRPDKHFKIVDQTGALFPATKKYYFSYDTWNQRRNGFPRYSLHTADGYIYPDGSPVFPKIKEGNASLHNVAEDWFTVVRQKKSLLIDTNNTEVLPGFNFRSIQGSGRLYLINIFNKWGVPFQCYIDDKRRLYGDKAFFQTVTPETKK